LIDQAVEWAKLHACATQWSEEVTLLVDEMCWVLLFLAWQWTWWLEQRQQRNNVRSDMSDGLIAYSFK
jgi:hypothetical protein